MPLRMIFSVCLCLALCFAPQAKAAQPRQGDELLELLGQVYTLEGGPSVRGGELYFVPQKPGLTPIALTGPAPASLKDDPPVARTLAQLYPVGTQGRYPAKGFDPGRLRNEALLKALYGASAAEVQKSCEEVDFLGQKVLFNRRQGASAALKRVVARLKTHVAAHPTDMAYILPSPGTFSWRPVKDTGRLSAHAFGIAMDLNVDKGLYWLWNPPAARVESTRKNYPQAIVDAFEAEGFIWGGKWDAFDFMHFEYRPELLIHARSPIPSMQDLLIKKPRPDN